MAEPVQNLDEVTIARLRRRIDRVLRHKGYYIPEEMYDDLAQDCLTELWAKGPQLADFSIEQLEAFARTLAHRRCVDWVRRARKEQSSGVPDDIPDVHRPDDELAAKELSILAQRVFAELPESCRDLIRLRLDRGLTYTEIAELQGRNEPTVRKQYSDCAKRLRRIYVAAQCADAAGTGGGP